MDEPRTKVLYVRVTAELHAAVFEVWNDGTFDSLNEACIYLLESGIARFKKQRQELRELLSQTEEINH